MRLRAKSTVILSAAIPFARERDGGVERPLAALRQLEREGIVRMRFDGRSPGAHLEHIGVLRLHGRFASRSSHSAQDDNVQSDRMP